MYQVPWLVNLPVPDGEAGESMMKQAADGQLYRETVDFDYEILKAKDEMVKKVAEKNFVNSWVTMEYCTVYSLNLNNGGFNNDLTLASSGQQAHDRHPHNSHHV